MLRIIHLGEQSGEPDYLLASHLIPPEFTYYYQLFIGIVRNKKKLFLEHFVIFLVHLVCYNEIPK